MKVLGGQVRSSEKTPSRPNKVTLDKLAIFLLLFFLFFLFWQGMVSKLMYVCAFG